VTTILGHLARILEESTLSEEYRCVAHDRRMIQVDVGLGVSHKTKERNLLLFGYIGSILSQSADLTTTEFGVLWFDLAPKLVEHVAHGGHGVFTGHHTNDELLILLREAELLIGLHTMQLVLALGHIPLCVGVHLLRSDQPLDKVVTGVFGHVEMRWGSPTQHVGSTVTMIGVRMRDEHSIW